MKILMLAPHPFYQERGTPIAIDLLLRALSEQGHQVDVITFPEGSERHYDNVSIHRVRPWFKVEGVRPGFSFKKLVLDVFVFFSFVRLFFSKRYDAVHAVEESVYMAMLVCPLRRCPYIYDMDSSMVTQLIDKAPKLRLVEGFLRFLESLPVRFARVVVPCCDALADDARQYRKMQQDIMPLKDISLLDKSSDRATQVNDLRARAEKAVKQTPAILMYIGNLESYQGIDLMLEAFAIANAESKALFLAVVGGEDADIAHYAEKGQSLGVAERVLFLGKQPVADLYALMQQADILLSPRTQGVNTPMKVYSYLDSGKPVVATRLPTHTQVMDDDIAMLTEPDPESYASGIRQLVDNAQLKQTLASEAIQFIQKEHSWQAFEQQVRLIYARLS